MSPEILVETTLALASGRFGSVSTSEIQTFLAAVIERCELFRRPSYHPRLALPSAVPLEDRHVVEAALLAECDYLLSGDLRLVQLRAIGSLIITRVREIPWSARSNPSRNYRLCLRYTEINWLPRIVR